MNDQVTAGNPAEGGALPENDDIRADIERAIKEVEQRQDNTPDTEKIARPRDDAGKFAKTDKPIEDKTGDAKPQEQPAEIPADKPKEIKPPQSWKAEAKAKFATLDPEVQAEILRREDDVTKQFSKQDEERSYGKSLKEVITPYMPMIAAEGGNPVAAVQQLLNTAYQLRTGTPQVKAELVKQIAATYGVNLQEITQESPEYIDPEIKALREELAQFKGQFGQTQAIQKQQEQAAIQSQIDAFASDPENVHYETVKAEMAALLVAGRAKDLKEAYEMAVWARPDIRSTLLEKERQAFEAKRVADAKAKAEAARSASGSVIGGPGVAVPNTGNPERTLEETIAAHVYAAGFR